MDFALFEALLNSLDCAEIIRLNYSGESANYPRLIEAITKARTISSAYTEMVTSLVSMPIETILRLPGSGIDRISLSLHSLDKRRFPLLYGGGSPAAFERRLEMLLQASRLEARPPVIDFAVVANAIECARTACAYFFRGGMRRVFGFGSSGDSPRRCAPLFHVEAEDGGRLTDAFERTLKSDIETARVTNPGMKISIARPADCGARAGSFSCEQNPFETTHILSNGDVVACEVMDTKPLGNLRDASFSDIWQGPAYADLRARYAKDEISECAGCIFRAAVHEIGGVRICWGWHDRDQSNVVWSRTTCSFECDANKEERLVLTGLLPPGLPSNKIEFMRDGQPIASSGIRAISPFHFGLTWRLTAHWRRIVSSPAPNMGILRGAGT